MLRHREAQLGNGGAAIGEQALAKCRVDPGPGHDARAVARHPLLLGKAAQFLDGLGGLQAALVERRLDGIDTPLHRRGALDDAIMVGHIVAPQCSPNSMRR